MIWKSQNMLDMTFLLMVKKHLFASRWLSDKQAKEDIKSRFDDCKVTNIKKVS